MRSWHTNHTGNAKGQPSARSVVRMPVCAAARNVQSSSSSKATPTSAHSGKGGRNEEAVVPVGSYLAAKRLPDLEVRVGRPRFLLSEWIHVIPFLPLAPNAD